MTLVYPPANLQRLFPNFAGPMESPFTVAVARPSCWAGICGFCHRIQHSMEAQGFDVVSIVGGADDEESMTLTVEIERAVDTPLAVKTVQFDNFNGAALDRMNTLTREAGID